MRCYLMRAVPWIMLVTCFLLNGCATDEAFLEHSKPGTPGEVYKTPVIQRISFSDENNYTRIQIEASEPIPAPFYKVLSDPLRIVIDIPNVNLKEIKEPLRINNGVVSEVRTNQFEDKGRVEIGLIQMTDYNISKQENTLLIEIEKVWKTAGSKEQTKEEALKELTETGTVPETTKEEPPTAQPLQTPGAVETVKESEIPPPAELKKDRIPSVQPSAPATGETLKKAKNIVKLSFEEKREFIVFHIVADGKIGNYNTFKLDSPSRLVLDIWNVGVRIPQKSFSVKGRFVKKVRTGKYPDKLRIVFDSRPAKLVPYHVTRTEDTIHLFLGKVPQPSEAQISLEGKLAQPVPESKPESSPPAEMKQTQDEANKKELLDKKETKKEETGNEQTKEPTAAKQTKVEQAKTEKGVKEEEKAAPNQKKPEKPNKAALAQPNKGSTEKNPVVEAPQGSTYTGTRLSLDFKDADIKNILRLIAEVSNFNIITGDDVSGKVTMRLVDVPWDQALELILQAKSLGMSKVGNVIRIAPAETLKKEVQGELEAKRMKEKLEDLITELIPVNYASAKEILPQVKSVLSDRGDVKVDERTNILILRDISRNIISVKTMVKSLDTKTPQVIIEARIIEANTAFQRDLGVSWGFLAQTGTTSNKTSSVGGGTSGISTLREATGTDQVNTRPVVDLPVVGAPSVEFLFTSVLGLKTLDVAISAAEETGNVKIISSPKIATLDNKEASVEQGLRIPYLKLTTEGTVTTDFIDANLKLTVTPHVTNDGHIKMSIKAKKDAPDTSITVMGVPSIDKKEAMTEVMIKDGGVVVIAGIYTIEKSKEDFGVPLLSKIPVLGWLFKSQTKKDTRRDLLIFICPKIMKDQPA